MHWIIFTTCLWMAKYMFDHQYRIYTIYTTSEKFIGLFPHKKQLLYTTKYRQLPHSWVVWQTMIGTVSSFASLPTQKSSLFRALLSNFHPTSHRLSNFSRIWQLTVPFRYINEILWKYKHHETLSEWRIFISLLALNVWMLLVSFPLGSAILLTQLSWWGYKWK